MSNRGDIHPRVLMSPAATPKRSNGAKSQKPGPSGGLHVIVIEVGHTGLGCDLQQVRPEGAIKQGFGGQ